MAGVWETVSFSGFGRKEILGLLINGNRRIDFEINPATTRLAIRLVFRGKQ